MRNILSRLSIFVLISALLGEVAGAQVDTGSIAGTVTDPSGAVVPHVSVTATSVKTNVARTATTSATGSYQFESLGAAVYVIRVAAPGFEGYKAQVEVTVGGHVTLSPKLQVGAGSTNVEVVALGGAQVNTTTQEVSEIITPEQVQELPSLTRNVYDFVGLSGNVSQGDSAQGHDQNSTSRGVGFSINGQRSSGTEILLDGVENTELFSDAVGIHVPVDSVGEYRVLTSNFDAQYGRASGGVVNVITNSGGNTLHGVLTEYNRLSAYTATTETDSQAGNKKGVYTRNQPSFFVSGPVLRDRLFFAVGAEFLRVRSNITQQNWVPTADLIAASASATQNYFAKYGQSFNYAQTITNKAAGMPFDGLDENLTVLGLVKYSVPQDAGGDKPQDTNNYTARLDYNHSDKTQGFVRYVGWKLDEPLGTSYSSPYAQYDVGTLDKDFALLGSVTHVFTPSLLTSGRLSFSRINNQDQVTAASKTAPTLLFGSGARVNTFSVKLPGNDEGLPMGGPQNVLQWTQEGDWQRKNHSIKFGGEVLYIQENHTFGAYSVAEELLAAEGDSIGYSSFVNGVAGTVSSAINPQGKFPGESISTPVTQPNFARSNRFHDWSVFAQDSWHARPKLTLNYGVRYEYFGVQHNNKQSLDSNFYYGTGSSWGEQIRTGAVYTAPTSPIHKLWNRSVGTVSPRVGFAYDLRGTGQTVLRGGWGVSYERNFGNVTFNVIQNPPNYAVVVQNNIAISTSNLAGLDSNVGEVPLPGTSLRHVDQNIHTAQTHFWNLTLEQQLGHSSLFAIEYLGARGVHLYDIKNINGLGSGNYIGGDSYAVNGLTRLNSSYKNINSRGSNGDSYYEAVNAHFATRDIHHSGLSVTANYTFGHAIDDLSSTFSDSNAGAVGENLGYTNPFDPGYDRGTSDLDIRQRFVFSPVYTLPWYKNRRDLKGEALGGWLLTGIFTARTGSSFTYYDSTYNYGDYYNIQRYVPSTQLTKWKYTKSLGAVPGAANQYYLSKGLPVGKAEVNNDLGGYSNWIFPKEAPKRNSFVGPGAWNLDLALAKQFPVTKRVNVEFRAEGFNVLNHHNLYVQQSLADAANYYPSAPVILAQKGGVGGSANEERRFGQFALKVNF